MKGSSVTHPATKTGKCANFWSENWSEAQEWNRAMMNSCAELLTATLSDF